MKTKIKKIAFGTMVLITIVIPSKGVAQTRPVLSILCRDSNWYLIDNTPKRNLERPEIKETVKFEVY